MKRGVWLVGLWLLGGCADSKEDPPSAVPSAGGAAGVAGASAGGASGRAGEGGGSGQGGSAAGAGGSAQGGAGGEAGQGGAGGEAGQGGSAAGGEAGQAGAGPSGPSCQGQAQTCGPGKNQDCGKACGPNQDEDCCTSPLVTGGSFKMAYDGVELTGDEAFFSLVDDTHSATVADFRLDRFEITVGRFRQFVDAVVGGWQPAAGAGLHGHLPGGKIMDEEETGWDATWQKYLPADKAGWDKSLLCDNFYPTWTKTPGAKENTAINCLTWYQAYAFCIWDGGFLPTEAEWNYAASGGPQQRVYPWSDPPGSTAISGMQANYYGDGFEKSGVPGTWSKGDGVWGQADLAGNINEWALDWFSELKPGCDNCAKSIKTGPSSIGRISRGGHHSANSLNLRAGDRGGTINNPALADGFTGGRCARSP